MSQIRVNHLTFAYEGSFDNIFENVSFSIDTDWKLGFIGRNGKGKSTFLNLLMGKYEYTGSITSNAVFDYFPYDITEGGEPVYAELPGWKTDMTKMQSEDEFPEEFNAYLTFLEEQLGVEIKIVSVGPDRAQTIERYTEE